MFSHFVKNSTVMACPSQSIISGGSSYCCVSFLVMLTLITCLTVSSRLLFTVNVLVGRNIEAANILVLIVLPSMNFSKHRWILPAAVITVVFAKWWFSVSILSTPFILLKFYCIEELSCLVYLTIPFYLDKCGFIDFTFTLWVIIHYYHY